jgi:hypothetical protein
MMDRNKLVNDLSLNKTRIDLCKLTIANSELLLKELLLEKDSIENKLKELEK